MNIPLALQDLPTRSGTFNQKQYMKVKKNLTKAARPEEITLEFLKLYWFDDIILSIPNRFYQGDNQISGQQ